MFEKSLGPSASPPEITISSWCGSVEIRDRDMFSDCSDVYHYGFVVGNLLIRLCGEEGGEMTSEEKVAVLKSIERETTQVIGHIEFDEWSDEQEENH